MTHPDENVDEDGGSEDLGTASGGHAADVADDLDGLAVLGEREEGRHLRLEELRLRIGLGADIY